jgi:Zn-dependent peptidase ImmA (M78 family)|tara:strand:- start:360 stop:713 length:354 start_codon:yes stop_codon:yes gene_type:complete
MFEIIGQVRNRDLVEQYTANIINKFRLDRRKHGMITIRFRKRMPKDYGDSLGSCEGDRKNALIDIAQKQTFYEQMLTLAHEMVHAKQFMRGEYPSEMEAKNSEYDLFGRCYPWKKVK